jgi:hypothetical protein
MRKLILALALIGTVSFGQLIDPPFTQGQVDDGISDSISQLGAGGYSIATNVVVLADTWTDIPASFVIPYVSSFEYVTNSTVRYINGDRAFALLGSCSLSTDSDNGALIQVGLETNGVYVAGSSSGERSFSIGTAGSLSYNYALNLSSNDTVGLVVRSTAGQNIIVNTWQSIAIRF